jgi:hypothetical protein
MTGARPQKRRHPDNPNLILHEEPTFHGMPVQYEADPLIENYLYQTWKIIQTALLYHPRITAMRFDLRLPQGMRTPKPEGIVMTAFWECLKDRIEHDRARAKKDRDRGHDTSVHHIRVMEYDQPGERPHWHCVLLVSREAYLGLGRIGSEEMSMYDRIVAAWNSALGLVPGVDSGLVHIPHNPVYHLDRNSDGSDFRELFYRLSYFAKARSKQYGGSVNAFGGSRIDPSLVGT